MSTVTDPLTDTDRHNWRITLAVMFTAQFLSGVGFSFVLPFFPFYFRDLGVESNESIFLWMGFSHLVFGITMTFSAPLWGIVADRYGRKLMVMRSMLAGSIIMGLMGLARTPWHLLVLRICQGATTGTISASITLVSSITPSANLGISLGLMQTAVLLGQAAGMFIGGILAERYGFRIPCGFAFIILFSGTLLVYLFTSEKFIPPRKARGEKLKTIAGILNTRGFKIILSVYFLIYVLSTMIIPILPLFIEELLGNSEKAISLTGLFGAVTVTLLGVSGIVFGKLGDRFGHTRILLFSLLITGIVSIPQAFANSIEVLFIERCLFGLAAGGIIPSVNAMVSNIISREKIGSAYGLTSSVTCFGIGMGPFIGGTMASMTGPRVPFAVMGLSTLIITVLFYRMIYNHSALNNNNN